MLLSKFGKLEPDFLSFKAAVLSESALSDSLQKWRNDWVCGSVAAPWHQVLQAAAVQWRACHGLPWHRHGRVRL
jgi:hypothetical protein